MKIGVYYALLEWFHPLFIRDKDSNFTQTEFVTKKILPQMKEIVSKYKPDLFWADDFGRASEDYWKSKTFLSWLYTESEVKNNIVVNDRWGKGVMCKHGDFYTCQDNFNPSNQETLYFWFHFPNTLQLFFFRNNTKF